MLVVSCVNINYNFVLEMIFYYLSFCPFRLACPSKRFYFSTLYSVADEKNSAQEPSVKSGKKNKKK